MIYSHPRKAGPVRGPARRMSGVIVQNVGTILAIREAVLYNRPLFCRYMTISGNAIRTPGNYKVRIGTRIADIVEECGGFREKPARIIMGGPMCGVQRRFP